MEPRLSRVYVALALCAIAACQEGRGSGVEGGQDLAAREAAMAATVLASENERLQGEVDRLTAELEQARGRLAKSVAQLDVERSRAGEGAAAGGPEALVVAEAAVVDASKDLGMVVLGIGAGAGVRPGMRFAVLRGERVIAKVRAADVRAGVTGALVEEQIGNKDDFPEKGDRAVIWREAAR